MLQGGSVPHAIICRGKFVEILLERLFFALRTGEFPAQVELFSHGRPFVRPERLHPLLNLKKPVDLVLHIVRHANEGFDVVSLFTRGVVTGALHTCLTGRGAILAFERCGGLTSAGSVGGFRGNGGRSGMYSLWLYMLRRKVGAIRERGRIRCGLVADTDLDKSTIC